MPKPAITRVSNLQISPSSTNVEKGFYLENITTAQRDVMTKNNGLMLYNTDTNTYQVCQNNAFTNLSTEGGNVTLTAPSFATGKAPVVANGNIYYDSTTNALTIGVSGAYTSVYTSPLAQGGNLVMQSAAIDPGTPVNGEVYYNTVTNVIRARVNGAWNNIYTQSNLGFAFKRTATAIDYQVLNTDVIIGVTDTTIARTITLPLVANTTVGQIFIIKDESNAANTNNITISRNGANIDAAAADVVITQNSGVVSLYSSGAAWFTIEKRV